MNPTEKLDPQQTARAYERWLGTVHPQAHARRTAERWAAHLLPHLAPGMALIDIGCGPGSITLGLAAGVAPGAAVGLDENPHVLEAARRLALDHSASNLTFRRGDACELPFEDESFDAVYMNAILQHLPDAAAAVDEAVRVLRPGGVIALSDTDYAGSLIFPETTVLARSIELVRELRSSGGADQFVGRKLRALLTAAGCARTEGAATAGTIGSAEPVAREAAFQAAYFASPELRDHAVALGLATYEELAGMPAAWQAWGAHPGAFWARFSCQALGWKGAG